MTLYIALDVESGALEHAAGDLLTGSFFIIELLPGKFAIKDRFNFALKQDTYRVTAGALKVNRIDLVEHDAKALEQVPLTAAVSDFLKKYCPGNTKLVPVGHNCNFDLTYLKAGLPLVSWNKFLSYRCIDTISIAYFCQMRGWLPADLSLGLESLAKFFSIPHKAHTAEGDVEAMMQVFGKMMKLGKKKVASD